VIQEFLRISCVSPEPFACPLIDESPQHGKFMEEVRNAAKKIASENAEFASEICNICLVVKRIGMLAKIYEVQMGCEPPACACDSKIILP